MKINITDTISINTASIDELNVTKININNVTGSADKVLINVPVVTLHLTLLIELQLWVRTCLVDLSAGTPVYITSYESDNIYGVDNARNDVDGQSAIGIYQEDIIATETGNVILSGLVRSTDLDTSGTFQ